MRVCRIANSVDPQIEEVKGYSNSGSIKSGVRVVPAEFPPYQWNKRRMNRLIVKE